jgi:hypothetical protein
VIKRQYLVLLARAGLVAEAAHVYAGYLGALEYAPHGPEQRPVHAHERLRVQLVGLVQHAVHLVWVGGCKCVLVCSVIMQYVCKYASVQCAVCRIQYASIVCRNTPHPPPSHLVLVRLQLLNNRPELVRDV